MDQSDYQKDSESLHTYERWYKIVVGYDRVYKKWESRAERIVKRYRDDQRYQSTPNARFNILWSNVQVITPAIFARLPRPDVSRRFRDNDPIGRVASMMLERALEYELEHCQDYKAAMSNAVLDRLLGGRGTAWVRYEPHFTSVAKGEPEDGYQVTEDIEAGQAYDPSGEEQGKSLLKPDDEEEQEYEEQIESEYSPVDYVHWRDFGHTIARTWEEVNAVWRVVYMGRPALVERFGEEVGNQIPLDTKPEDQANKYYKPTEEEYEAEIYEIWDKDTEQVIWLSKSMGKILDVKDDPLELEGFFPCPKPLYSTITTDSLEPIPDFTQYQDQARELDTLADRIDGLIAALRVRGVYDSAIPELQRLLSEGSNNTLIPVQNWGAFSEKNGLNGAIDLIDLKPFAEALNLCYQAMEQVKGQIYEIIGISDIQRGQTDPNETLGAQIIKSNNASGRLKTMQHNVVDFATKLLQFKAQIMCKHYTDETLVAISGASQLSPQDQMLIPQALQLLRQESSKNFRIEVTSDSMIFQDEQAEKNDRVAFLSAVGQFMQMALPVASQAPQLTPMLMEMLKFGVTAFKAGKQMEGIIDETADKFREEAKRNEGQPKPPPPEVQKLQMEMQGKAQEMQAKAQMEAQKMQAEQAFEQQKIQMEMQARQQEAQLKQQVEQAKIQAEMELARAEQEYQAQETKLKYQLEDERNQFKMQLELELERAKYETEVNKDVLITYLNNTNKIETARISAGLDDGSTAYIANVEQAKMMQAQLGLEDMAKYQGANEPSNTELKELMAMMMEQMTKPKRVIRDEQGRIAGVVHDTQDQQTPEGM